MYTYILYACMYALCMHACGSMHACMRIYACTYHVHVYNMYMQVGVGGIVMIYRGKNIAILLYIMVYFSLLILSYMYCYNFELATNFSFCYIIAYYYLLAL